jgi:hypothetical protein
MGVGGPPETIQEVGAALQGLPKIMGALPATPQFEDGLPLSGAMARLHKTKADAAVRFAQTTDDGIAETAKGLMTIGKGFAEIDGRGRNAILEVFHEQPPAPGGAPR